MGSRVWSPRSRMLTTTGAVLGLVWLTVWLLDKTSPDDGAGIANVLALPATALGTAVALIGLGSRPRADDPKVLTERARDLLAQVITGEARALQQLLGDTGDPRPADVGFTQPEAALLRWRTDGGDRNGSLTTIAEFYRGLNRGRLVILGDPGSGKTVLAIRLLLDLANDAHATLTGPNAEQAGQVRIPVRLSLPTFVAVDVPVREDVQERLDAWIVEHLVTVYSLEHAVAQVLLHRGWVLPVLDGLDEMDLDEAEPVRARTVLDALNLPAGPDRWSVVLTCRTARYQQLADSGRALQDATAVVLQPLDVEQVVSWLAHRFPAPGEPDGVQQRWRRVITALRRHPTGRLARCLTSPWRLFLAVAAYQDSGSDPRELTRLDAEALNEHLISRIVPAVTTEHPRPGGGHYDPDEVRHWLHTLARHLAHMRQRGNSGVDLYVHELWCTTGDPTRPGRRVRYCVSALIATVASLSLLALGTWAELTANGDPHMLLSGLVSASPVLLVFFLGVFLATTSRTRVPLPRDPQRLDLSVLRTPTGLRRLLKEAAGALTAVLLIAVLSTTTVAVVSGLSSETTADLTLGLLLLVAGGLPALVMSALANPQHAAARPSDPIRQVMAHDLTHAVVAGLPIGLVVELAHLYQGALVGGLTIGLTFTTLVSLRRSPWLHYAIAVHGLRRTDRLPRRFTRFLDWAYEAGLLRLSGIAVQFRHRELQDWLTRAEPTAEKSAS